MTALVRKLEGKLVFLVCLSVAILASVTFFAILIQIFISAVPSLTWYFFTTPESKTPHIGMGIANAIVGTVFVSLAATILAVPVGLGTAIYLQKYATNKRLADSFRFSLEVLSGTPSIVVGMFGFLVLVYYLRSATGGFSLLSASIALSILIMPVIERAIEEAISKVSRELEEASYALGADKWQTIRDVTIPVAMSGIITGTVLGFGRAAEESAVVILTAGYSQFMPEFAIKPNDHLLFGMKIYPIQDLVGTLPYSVYNAWENSNVVPVSNAFAAAFVLIAFVLTINVIAKGILSSQGAMVSGNEGGSLIGNIKKQCGITGKPLHMPDRQETSRVESVAAPSEFLSAQKQQSYGDRTVNPPWLEKISPLVQPATDIKNIPEPDMNKPEIPMPEEITVTPGFSKNPAKIFFRTLLPFTIPAALLLLIAFLATIPPLHHTLGKATPFLAGAFATGLSIIIIVAGLAFALLLAKKSGAFKKKTRRIGYAGVITGVCLLCIAGIICASAASGVFSTGSEPAKASTGDRNAQLAALLAAGDTGSGSSEVQVQEPQVQVPATPSPAQGSDMTVTVPRKDALSVGESYSWGDALHTSRATVYDYKVLPFYFFWWIDYNRFVLQMPAAGNSYLVVFIRMENTGTQSSIIPSADAFNVTYRGNSTGRLPYLNTSLISTWQFAQLGTENLREQFYQWIREIGQKKRDYAYLTGENLFTGGNSTTEAVVTPAVSATSSTTLNSTSGTGYNGAYLKPGQSQAIDGYLIFEVPDEATKHLNETYVDVSFNILSRGRWKLGY